MRVLFTLYCKSVLELGMKDSQNDTARTAKPTCKVRHDKTGKAVWDWAPQTGRFAAATTSRILRRLDVKTLAIESEAETRAASAHVVPPQNIYSKRNTPPLTAASDPRTRAEHKFNYRSKPLAKPAPKASAAPLFFTLGSKKGR
jgi:hypothetical protein